MSMVCDSKSKIAKQKMPCKVSVCAARRKSRKMRRKRERKREEKEKEIKVVCGVFYIEEHKLLANLLSIFVGF